MKKLKLIYNPFSGNKSFRFDLDVCVRIFQTDGYEVHIFRTIKPGDIEKHIQEMEDIYDMVVVSGGDGTVNLVVSALMKYGKKIPLGIIPSGTANDFASYLHFKTENVEETCTTFMQQKPFPADVGRVNNHYFINVFGGGLLSNISQKIDNDFKHAFGTLAYYIKGVEQIPNFQPIPLRITNSVAVMEENVFLFLVLNTSGAGSFDRLAPGAEIDDGYFDFVAVKARPLYELPVLFLKIMKGDHIGDPNILYFRDDFVRIECMSENKLFWETNIDGENGPSLPVEIRMLKKAQPIFSNSAV